MIFHDSNVLSRFLQRLEAYVYIVAVGSNCIFILPALYLTASRKSDVFFFIILGIGSKEYVLVGFVMDIFLPYVVTNVIG